MKRTTILLTLFALALALTAQVTEAKRAKPLKAYISGAKIRIVEGHPLDALVLLDSASMNYGLVPEAIHYTTQVYVDLIERASGPVAKQPLIDTLLMYVDSLYIACDPENSEVEKNYKKDCEEYIELADSTKLKYFREFYNEGRENLEAIERFSGDLEGEQDSARVAYIRENVQSNIDSLIMNMKVAIMIDSADFSTYIAIGDAYDRQGDYQEALSWMKRGYDRAADPTMLSQQLAYYYVQLEDYCGAIPYYKEYVEANPDSVTTLNFLAICYNNCGLEEGKRYYLDSAMQMYRQVLAKTPGDINTILNAGRYFMMKAQQMTDSARTYREAEDTETAKEFESARREMFDSSRTYFAKAFAMVPDNDVVAEQYAFASALLQDCESAVKGFEIVAQARPDDAGNWTSLGDCYLRMANYEEAIRAYENVARLKPDKIQVWENLQALYKETKQPDKAAEAGAKVKELQS